VEEQPRSILPHSLGGVRQATGRTDVGVEDHLQRRGGGEVNDRSELALQDYDHLPEGSAAHRIRSLTVEELAQVLEYEREHANRLSVVQLLSERIKQVESGASLSSGTSSEQRRSRPSRRLAARRCTQPPGRNQHLRVGTASRTRRRSAVGAEEGELP
jgi:hypothetical protein